MLSTGCATLKAASLHPWLQPCAPLGQGRGDGRQPQIPKGVVRPPVVVLVAHMLSEETQHYRASPSESCTPSVA